MYPIDAHGSSLSLRTMSVPAVAVYATGTPPITALCCVTDCSAFGGSFFAGSAPFSGGFSGGFSCARALPPRTAARASIAATFRLTVPPLFTGTCRAKISRIAARRAILW